VTQFPFIQRADRAVSDSEIDNDGLVDIGSALGATLGGREPDYFDHAQVWPVASVRGRTTRMAGSWYRDTSKRFDGENHSTITRSAEVGRWVAELLRSAGPACGPSPRSSFQGAPAWFNEYRPTLVVVMHGATVTPNTVRGEGVGTPAYFSQYWGYELISGLFGGAKLRLMASDRRAEIAAPSWNAGGVFRSTSPLSLLIGQASATSHRNASLTALATYRDGSKKLVEQTSDAIQQIYANYKELFGDAARQPQIVFLAHSMGGLVARTLLTRPTARLNGVALSADDREKAAYLAERTAFLVTLATPHEGSPVADASQRIVELLDSPPFGWVGQLKSSVGLSSGSYMLRALGGDRDATRDLRRSEWRKWNRGPLAPHLAQRPDGSLIPVYCTGGRSPGGRFFDQPNLPELNVVDGVQPDEKDAVGLVLLDWALRRIDRTAWGRPAPGTRDLDRVLRTDRATLAGRPFEAVLAMADLAGLSVTSNVAKLVLQNLPVYLREPWTLPTPIDGARFLVNAGRGAAKVIDYLLAQRGLSLSEVMSIVKALALDLEDAVEALIQRGVNAAKIAAELDHLGFNKLAIGGALAHAGVSIKQLASALDQIGATLFQIAQALHRAEASAPVIAKVLRDHGAKAQQVADILAQLSYGVAATALALKAAGLSLEAILIFYPSMPLAVIAKELKKAGFKLEVIATLLLCASAGLDQVAKAMLAVSSDPAKIAAALHKAGMAVGDVARVLVNAGVRLDRIAMALTSAGFDLLSVNGAMATLGRRTARSAR